MRLPLTAKWYQYSSIEPSDAISRSAMSRAPATLWSSFSGSAQPSAETRRAHDVHRMRGCRQLFEHGLDRDRQCRAAISVSSCTRRARRESAACRARAGTRFPRTRRSSRRRGCRSRDSADRCRCGRPCTAPCCRRQRRTARRISWAWAELVAGSLICLLRFGSVTRSQCDRVSVVEKVVLAARVGHSSTCFTSCVVSS